MNARFNIGDVTSVSILYPTVALARTGPSIRECKSLVPIATKNERCEWWESSPTDVPILKQEIEGALALTFLDVVIQSQSGMSSPGSSSTLRNNSAPGRPVPRKTPVLAVWLRDLVISLAISAFIIIFLYQPVKVEGTSMMPSLDDQERIFVNKFVYRWEPIERGDIVVFRYPRDPSTSYIKRVIGVAGDVIRIDAGQVYVNGEQLEEDYVPPIYADERSYPEIGRACA